MSNCIVYVGGLEEATSDCQLRDLFGTYGTVVRVHVIRHKHSEKSAGYGFVEMGSGEQARHAVSSLEGALFATLRHDLCIHSRLSFPSDGRKGDPSMSRVNWKLLQNR